jgi:hypothetical protein
VHRAGPPNQQNQQKHGSINSGRCHHKLPPAYSTYSPGGAKLPHHSFHQKISSRKRSFHRISSGGWCSRSYAIVAPAHPWVNPESPGGAPNEIIGGTAAVLLAERHRWEEAVIIFRTWTAMEQSLKKQIIKTFEPLYLEILNNDFVGFANATARDMLDQLFLSYGSITAVDLEHNWYPQQPMESFFKQIQDCIDYSEAGGVHHE